MELDYFKLLPLLTLLVFALPKVAKGYFAMFVNVVGAVVALVGAVAAIFSFNVPYVPVFDPISAVFAIAIASVAIGCSVFTVGYLKNSKKSAVELSLHYVAIVGLTFSMFFVIGAKTKFDFLLFWELMTLCSFVLLLFNAVKKEVLHAAVGYLVIMHIGFFAILYGMINYGDDAVFGHGTMPFWVWAIYFVGFGIKAGLFPMHIWLPVAYPIAPSHVSALMSGAMINMGVYGIFKATFATQDLLTVGYVMFVFGVVSALFGIVKASTQGDLKKLFAYSSIENIGIIFIGFGLGCIGKASANMPLALIGIGGALLHMVNHANYKAALFLSAGTINRATGTTQLNSLGGLLKKMPISGTMFLLAILAICAIPPFSGFFSEFILLSGMFEAVSSGNTVLLSLLAIVTIAIVGGLTVITFCKAFGVAMLGNPRSCHAENAVEANKMMILGFVVPIASILVGGFLYPIVIFNFSTEIINVNANVQPMIERFIWIEIVAVSVVALAAVLFGVKKWMQKKRANSYAPTWGCGFENLNPNVQYSAHSSSAEIENAITSSRSHELVGENEIYPTQKCFTKSEADNTNKFITHLSTHVLRRFTAKLALFQTGKVNHYILHALIFIMLVLALSVMSLL